MMIQVGANTVGTCTRQRGVAMVEFVVFAPIVLFMLMATAEFGRALLQYNELTKGIREGIRYVAEAAHIDSSQVATISNDVLANTQNLVVYGSINAAGAPRLPGLAPASISVVGTPTQDVIINAQYVYQPILVSLPWIFQSGSANTGFTFQASVTMRVL